MPYTPDKKNPKPETLDLEALLHLAGCSPNAMRTMLLLLYWREDGVVQHASLQDLADAIPVKTTRDQVRDAIAELEHEGLVKVNRDNGNASTYELSPMLAPTR
jgi:hypothetical protein